MSILRTATGTRDFVSKDINLRQNAFAIFKKCCAKYGGTQLELSTLESYLTITSLYGEDFNKLVYKIDSNSNTESEKLFVKYDQTLQLARYINMNGIK